MRLLALIFLLNTSSLAHADEITCYSHGKKIYSGYGQDIDFVDGLFSFTEAKSDKIVFISADCVIKV